MRRILVAIAVLLVIGIAVVLAIGIPGTGEVQTVAASAGTTTISKTTIVESVESTGMIEAEQVSQLSFGVFGMVEEVLVDVGDIVEEGQMLATLDTADLEYEVRLKELALDIEQANYNEAVAEATEEEIAKAQATLLQAQTQLDAALADAETSDDELATSCESVATNEEKLAEAQEVYDDYLEAGYSMDAGFIPDPDSDEAVQLSEAQDAYDDAVLNCNITTTKTLDPADDVEVARLNLQQAQIAYDELLAGPDEDVILSAEAQLMQAEMALEQAQEDLADASIFAPFDGVITDVNIVAGENLESSANAMTIADNSLLHVDISVDELDIMQVSEGQQATVTLDAFEDTSFVGTVSNIYPAGSQSSGLVTYTVRVNVEPGTTTASTAGETASSTTAAPAETAPSGGFVQADSAATAGEALAADQAGMGPGGNSAMRSVMPIITEMGGTEALTALLAQEDGTEQFYALLREAGLTDEDIASIEEMGGPEAFTTMTRPPMDQEMPADADAAAADPAAVPMTDQAAEPAAPASDTTTASVSLEDIRLGMTAEVMIVINEQVGVLVVPTTAIQQLGAQEFIMVDDGSGGQTQVAVTTGSTANGMTVISGDVSEGQTVYIPVIESDSSANEDANMMSGMNALTGTGGGAPPERPR